MSLERLPGIIWKHARAGALAAAGMLLLAGQAVAEDARDPLEGFNRAVFAFNEGVDKAVVKPVARGYVAILPGPVRTGIGNVYSNVGDVFIAVNNVLQGKPAEAVGDTARFMFNSTFGLLGLLDVASEMGLEKHNEDFGQTLGRWGVGPGPYLVLPIYGPRDVRDGFGLAVEAVADPVGRIGHVPTRNSATVLRLVNERAELLPADEIIEAAAIDKYAYIRDAYLQRRRSLVYDGRPPREPDDE